MKDKYYFSLAFIIILFVFLYLHYNKLKKENVVYVTPDKEWFQKIDTVYVIDTIKVYKTKIVEKIIKDNKVVKDSSIIRDTLAKGIYLEITTFPAIDSIKIKGFIKDTIKTVWKIDSIVVKEYVKESRPFYDNFEYGVIGGLVLAIVLYLIGG